MGAIRNLINKATEQLDQTQLLQEALEYAKLKKVQNDEQAVAAAREYAANREQYRPAMQFMSWANNSYGGFRNQNEFQSAITQYKYNRDRKNRGLSELQFTDIAYDPTQFDDDKNEYNISYFSKNSEYPTEYGNAYQDFLNQKKVKTQYEAIGRTDYTGDSTLVEFDDGWKRKGYDYDPANLQDMENKALGLPPQAVLDRYDLSDKDDVERLKEGKLPKNLEGNIFTPVAYFGKNVLEGGRQVIEDAIQNGEYNAQEWLANVRREHVDSWLNDLDFAALGEQGESLKQALETKFKPGQEKLIAEGRDKAIQKGLNLENTQQQRQSNLEERYRNLDEGWAKDALRIGGQGVGQVGTMLAANALVPGSALGSIPGSALMFASGSGAGTTEALSEGASYEDARKYGTMSALAETAIEFASGGIGGLKNTGLLKAVTNQIDNLGSPFAKAAIRKLASGSGEAAEEIVSTLINPVIKRATYDPDAASATIEEYIQSGIGGFLPTLILGFGVDVLNTGTRRNAKTIGTAVNSEANTLFTVDGRFNTDKTNALFQRGDDGKLHVVTDDSGKIKLDTENKTLQQAEIKSSKGNRFIAKNIANNMEAQVAVRNYIKEQGIEAYGIDGNSPFAKMLGLELKAEESSDVQNSGTEVEVGETAAINNSVVSADKVFGTNTDVAADVINEADPNVKVIQTQSGQTRIRRVADDQMEAIKGIDKKRVKQVNRVAKKLGLDVQWAWLIDGQDSNGNFVSNGAYDPSTKTIYLSMDGEASGASNPYMAILGHEVTHSLEGSAEYNKLLDYAVQRAKENGTYDQQISQLQAAYKGQDAAIQHELTSNLMMEMFGDERFVRRFVNENRGIAGKILNALDSILAKLKGDESFAEFEKIRNLFAAAFNNQGEASGDLQHSISNNGRYVILDRNIFEGVLPQDRPRALMNYLEKNHKGEAIKTLDGEGNVENVYIADDQDRIKGKKALRKLAYPGRKIDNVQQEIVSHVDEIAAVSQYDHFGSDKNNKHGSFAKNGWDYRKAYAMTEDNRVWECILNVALGERRNVLYDINSIKEIRDQKAKEKIMKSDRNMNSQKQDSLQNQTEGAEIAGANTPLSQRNSRRQTSINQSISQDNAEVNTSVRSGQSDDTPDVQHSIVGRQAENANQSLMNQAMVEAEQGRSVDEIWQNTGWIKGQDGKWRFEIDDSSASLVGKAFQNLKDGQKVDLQDILHHPELMENYPQLKGIKVALDGNLRGYDAVYEPSNRTIRFSGEGVKNRSRAFNALLHETQHAVQVIEAFDTGGTPDVEGRWLVRQRYGDVVAKEEPGYWNTSPEQQEAMIMEYIYRRFPNAKAEQIDIDMLALSEYQKLLGEREANETVGRASMDAEVRRQNRPQAYDDGVVLPERQTQSALQNQEEQQKAPESGASSFEDSDAQPMKKRSRVVDSILENDSVAEESKKRLATEKVQGFGEYEVVSDQESITKAMKKLENRTARAAAEDVHENIRKGLSGKEEVVHAEAALLKASKEGDMDSFMRIAADLQMILTEAGQTVQAAHLLKKLTPEGRIMRAQNTVNNVNRQLKERKKGNVTVKLNQDLAKRMSKAKTAKEMDALDTLIAKDIGQQVPATIGEKLTAWRYMSMLANPRTHIRNIVGNAVMYLTVGNKNLYKKALEGMYSSVRPNAKMERSASFYNPNSAKAKAAKAFSKQDATEMLDLLRNGGKENRQSGVMTHQRIFNTKAIEWIRKLNDGALDAEDAWFLSANYSRAMTDYIMANDLDVKKMDTTTLQKARNVATQEALKATFRDANKLAEMLSNVENKGKVWGVLVGGIIPFKKTPMNILKRGVEYSPLGLIDGLTRGAYQLKKGEITISQFIERIASGLTGTQLVAIGAFMASIGLLRASGAENDREENFEKYHGEQPYSFRIGGYSYTLDWLNPINMPLFVGCELNNLFNNETTSDRALQNLFDALTTTTDPLMQLSCLQGINDAISRFGDDSGGAIADLAVAGITGYVGQYIPTIFGQVARTIDPKRRLTYAAKDSKYTQIGEQFARKLMNKIPGLNSKLQPYVDLWGEEDPGTENLLMRGLEQLIFPWYSNKIEEYDSVDAELERLYIELDDAAVLPSTPKNSVGFQKQTYYVESNNISNYRKKYGQTARVILEDAMDSSIYEGMGDTERAKLIKTTYEFAGAYAKKTALPNVPYKYPDEWMSEAEKGLKDYGIPVATYLLVRQECNSFRADINAKGNPINGSKTKKVYEYVNQQGLTARQKSYLYECLKP